MHKEKNFVHLLLRIDKHFFIEMNNSESVNYLGQTTYMFNFVDAHCIVFCSRVMGAAALQKYIGSLGGIGASGVGSSSSYSTKEINKDIMPEKVSDYSS